MSLNQFTTFFKVVNKSFLKAKQIRSLIFSSGLYQQIGSIKLLVRPICGLVECGPIELWRSNHINHVVIQGERNVDLHNITGRVRNKLRPMAAVLFELPPRPGPPKQMELEVVRIPFIVYGVSLTLSAFTFLTEKIKFHGVSVSISTIIKVFILLLYSVHHKCVRSANTCASFTRGRTQVNFFAKLRKLKAYTVTEKNSNA